MTIEVKQHYLWRAVDQDDEVVDVFVQKNVGMRGRQALLETLNKAS